LTENDTGKTAAHEFGHDLVTQMKPLGHLRASSRSCSPTSTTSPSPTVASSLNAIDAVVLGVEEGRRGPG
jgi:hypothetical protein